MRSEVAWTYIDPKPVFLYDPKYNIHLAFWNGISMTRSYALMIYGEIWCNMYSTESQKIAAFEEYNRAYRAGAFGTRAWDNVVQDQGYTGMHKHLMHLLTKKNPKFLVDLKSKYSPQEALNWFLLSRAIIDKGVKS